jgi:hypothetical protein
VDGLVGLETPEHQRSRVPDSWQDVTLLIFIAASSARHCRS